MTDRTAYRHRVTTVRGRARAQLAAIRKERLSRRKQVRHVADAIPPMTAMEAEPVEAQHAARAFAFEDTATGVPTEACMETPEDPPFVDDPTPGPMDKVETGAPGAAREADIDALAAEARAATDPADAEPETVDRGDDAVAAPDTPPAADPSDALASEAHALPEQDAQDEDPASSGAVDLACMDAEVPAAEVAPADAVVTAVTPACETAKAPGATDRQPEVSAPTPELIVAAGPDPQPTEAAPDAALATPQEVPPPPEAAPAWPADHLSEAEPRSDLFQIPGIGTGLVWMMQSAGIQCLDDLARAETRDLEERLGMISRLLDLDYFIEFARARDVPP